MPVKMNATSTIKARLGIEPNGRVQRYFTKRCADYMDKYVPFSRGGLAYINREIESDKVIYESPYAHYLYEGKAMGPSIPIMKGKIIVGYFSPKGQQKHYTGKDLVFKKTAGHEYAGPHWDRRMVSAEIQDLVQEVQDYINRGGK